MDTYETKVFAIAMITAMVLAVLIAYFSITVLRKHRTYSTNQQRLFLQQIDLLETDRNRIATDLHDELGAILSISVTQLGAISGSSEKDNQLLQQVTANICHLNDRINNIARNLTPKVLVQEGLRAAVHQFVAQVQAIDKIVVNLTYDVNDDPSGDGALHIYRIIQELVNNTLKHAQASFLMLQVTQRKQVLYILYRDNGQGFSNAGQKESASSGLGLTSIQSRIHILGGKMRMFSRPGVEYILEIPINPCDP